MQFWFVQNVIGRGGKDRKYANKYKFLNYILANIFGKYLLNIVCSVGFNIIQFKL